MIVHTHTQNDPLREEIFYFEFHNAVYLILKQWLHTLWLASLFKILLGINGLLVRPEITGRKCSNHQKIRDYTYKKQDLDDDATLSSKQESSTNDQQALQMFKTNPIDKKEKLVSYNLIFLHLTESTELETLFYLIFPLEALNLPKLTFEHIVIRCKSQVW